MLGGILTVAEDLLKNDGKKFIEMMEQLAERRMQREEEAHYAASGLAHASMHLPGQNSHAGHNHPPLPEDEDFEDEEDDEYDSQEDEEYEEDRMVGLMLSVSVCLVLTVVRTRCRKDGGWRKAVGCSRSSPPACSSRGS